MSSTPQVLGGSLYVVATPLGNLGDISERARAVLSEVDCIACEDTRVTGKLLSLLGISKKLVSYRDENERTMSATLLAQLQAGASIALCSDAGTPCISDPGFRLVRACKAAGVPVLSVPGACAIVAALSVSGLPSDGFLFVGFLPAKAHGLQQFLLRYKDFEYTWIAFESCHRIERTLEAMLTTLGRARTVCVARELTKLHETVVTGPIDIVTARVKAASLKGEFVVLVAPEAFIL